MKEIIKDIALRTVKTFCETLVSLITVGSLITEIDWLTAISVSTTAAVITILVNTVANINKIIAEGESNSHDEEV